MKTKRVGTKAKNKRVRRKPASKPVSRPGSGKKTVLVVGDWIVDEHWVIGTERSRMASRRGDAHYHAIHAASSTVVALCGAGIVTSLLGSDSTGKFTVHGVGLWHSKDERALKCMLDPTHTHGDTPFRVARSVPSKRANSNIHLHNIGTCIKGPSPEEYDATTRAIRFYNRSGDDVRLTHRVDWELYLPEDHGRSDHDRDRGRREVVRGWISDKKQLDALPKQIPFERLDAVIVKDLVKGVICDEMIQWLLSKTECNTDVPWFVSTKAWQPGWLNMLHDRNVRLLTIPQVSAQEAVRLGKINAWRVSGGQPSYTALKLIDEVITGFKEDEKRLIVALPKGMTVIAKSCKIEPELILHKKEELHPFAGGVPMASVLFSTLIAEMLWEPDQDHADLLHSALSLTDDWMVHEAKRIQRPLDWKPEQLSLLANRDGVEDPNIPKFKTQPWNTVRSAWKQARENHGIIDDTRLDLWRAMTDIDGYVCCVNSKRDVLKQLKRELSRFQGATIPKHTSVMIQANPGAGKSFLIQKTAEHLGFHLVLFNITQMISKRDLLDCFDTIVSTQSQLRGDRHLMVFFDEINVHLDNSPVYDMFLAPLADGTYTKEGKTFYIQPCVWLFAGTELDKRDKAHKGSDFEDRLSIAVQDFRIQPADPPDPQVELDFVYLTVYLIRRAFPDVRYITDKALEVFAHLDPDLSVRKIKRFVARLQDVRQTVRFSSIPKELRQEHVAKLYKAFPHSGSDEKSIEIWTSPDKDYGRGTDKLGAGDKTGRA